MGENALPGSDPAEVLLCRCSPEENLAVELPYNRAQILRYRYMELTIPGTDISRAYSLANLPIWDGRLDFLIRLHLGVRFPPGSANKPRSVTFLLCGDRREPIRVGIIPDIEGRNTLAENMEHRLRTNSPEAFGPEAPITP